MPDIHVSDELLARLTTVAENDYSGSSVETDTDGLLREHQEHVVLETAGKVREAVSRLTARGRRRGDRRAAPRDQRGRTNPVGLIA